MMIVTGSHCTRRGQRGKVVAQDEFTVTLRFDDGITELYGRSAVSS
jgi:hypothetical protein